MNNYSPWYPGTMNPLFPGWYEIRDPRSIDEYVINNPGKDRATALIVKRRWDGDHWRWIDDEGLESEAIVSSYSEWRGLAEDPLKKRE